MQLRQPSLLTLVFVSSWILPLRGSRECDQTDKIAQNVMIQGWTLSCCHPESLVCRVQSEGPCNAALVAYCLGAGSTQVCRTMAVSPGSPTIVLCTVHSGPAGDIFGLSPVSTESVSLLNAEVQELVQTHWHALSASDQAVVCSAGGMHFPTGTGIRLATWKDLNPPVCATGEYTLRCLGTDAQGLCTVYNTDSVGNMEEIGQHYFVNFNESLPEALTAHSSTSSITQAATASTALGSPPNPAIASGSHGTATTTATSPSRLIIAVPVAAAVLILGALATFFLRRRTARRKSISPYVRHLTSYGGAEPSKKSLWHTLCALTRDPPESAPSGSQDRSQGSVSGKSPTWTDSLESADRRSRLPPYSPT